MLEPTGRACGILGGMQLDKGIGAVQDVSVPPCASMPNVWAPHSLSDRHHSEISPLNIQKSLFSTRSSVSQLPKHRSICLIDDSNISNVPDPRATCPPPVLHLIIRSSTEDQHTQGNGVINFLVRDIKGKRLIRPETGSGEIAQAEVG